MRIRCGLKEPRAGLWFSLSWQVWHTGSTIGLALDRQALCMVWEVSGQRDTNRCPEHWTGGHRKASASALGTSHTQCQFLNLLLIFNFFFQFSRYWSMVLLKGCSVRWGISTRRWPSAIDTMNMHLCNCAFSVLICSLCMHWLMLLYGRAVCSLLLLHYSYKWSSLLNERTW